MVIQVTSSDDSDDDDRKPAALPSPSKNNKRKVTQEVHQYYDLCDSSSEDNDDDDCIVLDVQMQILQQQLHSDDDDDDDDVVSSHAIADPRRKKHKTTTADHPNDGHITPELRFELEKEEREREEQKRLDDEAKDYSLAMQLQSAEEAAKQQEVEAEEKGMYSSEDGQAWKLVETILTLHHSQLARKSGGSGNAATIGGGTTVTAPTLVAANAASASNGTTAVCDTTNDFISVIAVDDMVYTARRFLQALHTFHAAAQTQVQWDLGYHYTNADNLARIRTDGLLSQAERNSQSIREKTYNGSVYGDGIYAASNPYAYRNKRFGDIGVMVVRLHGGVQRQLQAHTQPVCIDTKPEATAEHFDSTVVSSKEYREFVVLRTAGQCLPLCIFSGTRLGESTKAQTQLEQYATKMRTELETFWKNALGMDIPCKPPSSRESYWGRRPSAQQIAAIRPQFSANIAGAQSLAGALAQIEQEKQARRQHHSRRSGLVAPHSSSSGVGNPTLQPNVGVLLRKNPPPHPAAPTQQNHSQRSPSLFPSTTGTAVRFKLDPQLLGPARPTTATQQHSQPSFAVRRPPTPPTFADRLGSSRFGHPSQPFGSAAVGATTSTDRGLRIVVPPTTPAGGAAFSFGGLASLVPMTTSQSHQQPVAGTSIPPSTKQRDQGAIVQNTIAANQGVVVTQPEIAQAPCGLQLVLTPSQPQKMMLQLRNIVELNLPTTILTYTAPTCDVLDEADLKEMCEPISMPMLDGVDGMCLLCSTDLYQTDNRALACLAGCLHLFHRGCIQRNMLASKTKSRQCPSCQFPLSPPRGSMPSGRMTVTQSPAVDCEGHAGLGSFIIQYSFDPLQIQSAYHPSPGTVIPVTRRVAYVPRSAKKLLLRLQFAFARGLTFKIGTSLTTGKSNKVVWAGIPHKSKHNGGGAYGFPDASYLDDCNAALDRLGVPASSTATG